MKNTNKQNFTVNALLLILLALLFFSGSLMWSQHNQYHNTLWNGQTDSQPLPSHMNWNNSTQ